MYSWCRHSFCYNGIFGLTDLRRGRLSPTPILALVGTSWHPPTHTFTFCFALLSFFLSTFFLHTTSWHFFWHFFGHYQLAPHTHTFHSSSFHLFLPIFCVICRHICFHNFLHRLNFSYFLWPHLKCSAQKIKLVHKNLLWFKCVSWSILVRVGQVLNDKTVFGKCSPNVPAKKCWRV